MRLAEVRNVVALLALATVLAVFVGCEAKPSTVSGKVTIDGKPVPRGGITFLPFDGDGPTAAGTIRNGEYSAEVFPGKKRVEILGYEVVGQVPAYGDPKGPMKDVTKAVVPPKYNQHSDLTAEIQVGNNDINFELDSK